MDNTCQGAAANYRVCKGKANLRLGTAERPYGQARLKVEDGENLYRTRQSVGCKNWE